MSKIIRCLVDRKRFYRTLTQILISTITLVIAYDGATAHPADPAPVKTGIENRILRVPDSLAVTKTAELSK